ncbi:MAG: HAMP domain-containing sensor histidine kinase [Sediminibacterium sp.]
MKLFSKYNRINIIASVVIFIAGSIAFYFALRYILIRQLDATLRTEQTEIMVYVKEHQELPEILNTNDQQISFTEQKEQFPGAVYVSEKKWNPKEREEAWIRKLTFGIHVKDRVYRTEVFKSQVETEDLLQLIIFIAVIMIATILLAGYLINRVVLKKLWQPFYDTVDRIRQYELTKQQPLQLLQTNIDEFSLLNQSVNTMTERVQQEYQTLKEFTGNAAHEMQTPLAVIATHTDALMQDEKVLQTHYAAIGIIEQSVSRLSRLNQSLLLLAKIENSRFELNEAVQWDVLLREKLDELQELITSQGLTLTISAVPVTTLFHRHLADIVISNLLNNSIRYNKSGGLISIHLNKEQLSVANTSAIPLLDEQKVFHRVLRPPPPLPEGNGLGLSIVKQICSLGNYRISYRYGDALHVFTIAF